MQNIKLFYIPFDTRTYMPVTVESMEEDAYCVFDVPITSDTAISLQDLLQKVMKGAFTDRLVRLKIKGLYQYDVYVDAFGGVIKSGQAETQKLKDEHFLQLRTLMNKLQQDNPQKCK